MTAVHLLFRAATVCACLLLALPAWGGVDEPPASTVVADEAVGSGIGRARALVNTSHFEEALVILTPLVRGGAVGTDVLFLFGLAAIGASHQPNLEEEDREAFLDGAIAAFRTMLVDNPGLVRVHLELGRAFFLKGEDDLARRHFEWVLAGNPPQPVVANVGRFLAAMQARRRWSFNLGASIAPDTNIGSGSDERTIYVFGLPFQRDAEELTSSGVGLAVWGGAEYHYPLDERVRLRAGANLSRREYGGSDFDQAYLSTHLGPRWLADASTEASVLATVSQRWQGTVKDHHSLGGRLEVGHRVSPRVTVNGRLSWEDRHYRTDTHLDGTAMDVSLGGSYVIMPTVRADLSLGYGRERPEVVRLRHEGVRVGAGVSVILPLGFTVGGGGEHRWTEYEPGWAPFVEDGGARKDRTWSARASVFNRGITLYGFSPEVSVIHETRETNAQAHGYERTRGEMRFVQQF